jgi:hypothetical protein
MTLVQKGSRLDEQGLFEESVFAYNEVVTRFGDREEAPLVAQVANGLNGLGFALLCSAKRQWLDGHDEAARATLAVADEKLALARARQPENPYILGNAGYVAFLLGRDDDARTLLATCFRLGGDEMREVELKDANIHSLPRDEEFRALLRSLSRPRSTPSDGTTPARTSSANPPRFASPKFVTSGSLPRWPWLLGATREHARRHVTEEQRRRRGWIGLGMGSRI